MIMRSLKNMMRKHIQNNRKFLNDNVLIEEHDEEAHTK